MNTVLTSVKRRADGRNETGQASVEYALVLLGAALVASLLIAWASKTNLLDQLFDHILGLIKGKAN
jgi:Flp pilus assembly pilin Flp